MYAVAFEVLRHCNTATAMYVKVPSRMMRDGRRSRFVLIREDGAAI